MVTTMTKIFLDANILVGVLNKEYPLFRMGSRLLSLNDAPGFQVYTSATCMAIAAYFAAKKCGEALAMQKMKILAAQLQIAPAGAEEVRCTVQNPKILDFEDGIEYYAALHAGCDVIVTEDLQDFHFSDIPVMSTESFLREVALPTIFPGRH